MLSAIDFNVKMHEHVPMNTSFAHIIFQILALFSVSILVLGTPFILSKAFTFVETKLIMVYFCVLVTSKVLGNTQIM